MLWLLAVVIVPLIIFRAGTLWMQFEDDRAQAEAHLLEQARTMARLVDLEFERTQAVARTLATSPALARGDLDTFADGLRAARDLLSEGLPVGAPPVRMTLVDAAGARLLDTSAPDGRGRGDPALPHVRAAIASGKPQISDLHLLGANNTVPVIAVAVPARIAAVEGENQHSAIAAIGATLPRQRLVAITELVDMPLGGFITVLDRQGVIVARSVGDAETVGKQSRPAVLQAIRAAESGLAPRGTRTLEGVPSTIAFARAPQSGYVVELGVSDAAFLAQLEGNARRTIVIGLTAVALSLLLAMRVARRTVADFRRVPEVAVAGAAMGGTPPERIGLREADDLTAVLAGIIAERERVAADARALFENSPVGVVISDTSGRVHAANNAFLTLIGRERADLDRRNLRLDEITPKEWLARNKVAIAEVAATGRCMPFEKEYLRPDGTRVPVLVSFGLVDRDTGVGAAFVVDLSERRAAEAALRESEARFRAITDTMPQMVWSARPDGYHDYYNRRWHDLTGTAPERAGEWSPVLHPDDREHAWALWRQSLATGEPFEVEYRIRMADGAYRWMLGRALPVRDPDTGTITRWFGTCTDIEDTVAAREALARSREDLERLVEERTHDLREAEARLAHAQRMEALGQLAGGIAHDFNNVLQAVQGAVTLIERRPADPEAVARLARLAREATGRGAAVTRRLLAFSRRGDLRAEPLDAASLLGGMREILAHTLGAGIEVRVETQEGLLPLLADKGQLETVLVNLATNARDAMSGQGVLSLTATAETVSREGHPAGLSAGEYLRLSVADTGSGMDQATLARVLEPFFTTKGIGRGTGLGLSMAKGFVEQSGGTLAIESTRGQGTVVVLWLPTTAGEGTTRPSSGKEQSAEMRTHARILLVDDETQVREMIAEELAAAGCTVLPMESGAQALERLDAGEAVDVVVTDLSMPGMDGIAVIREAQRRRTGLPAILLTGYATSAAEFAIGDMVNGPVCLLRKPVDGAALADQVAILVQKAHLQG
ncbi:PAS domain S-box protein [Paracraurococcus lichenis]|uniref:histidine kinase n=1 Tax=Paracraurococcus lichenis TaxID=3064888 RepID=A0ABT9E7W1_9PROT|nr:PAS domain S-box protein [Paracraurococcus sp. LOR1-02]MDO9712214.1 PAS domain S-box protein [Paracraurococcus sp. LOR1-02]